jgi:hypothetical protein
MVIARLPQEQARGPQFGRFAADCAKNTTSGLTTYGQKKVNSFQVVERRCLMEPTNQGLSGAWTWVN